jgi:hypothetical protein
MARAAYRVHVSEPAALTHLPPTVQPVRAVVWLLHLALPMAGLWLLLARPQVDVVWHHSVAHFWLVVTVAAVNVAIGVRMSAAALNRGDPRLFLVSLAFLASAGFFLVHALATPGVLLHHPNLGFDVAQPVGLTIAAVFAVASSLPRGGGAPCCGRRVAGGRDEGAQRAAVRRLDPHQPALRRRARPRRASQSVGLRGIGVPRCHGTPTHRAETGARPNATR